MEGDQSRLPHASPQVNTKRTRRRNLKSKELIVASERAARADFWDAGGSLNLSN